MTMHTVHEDGSGRLTATDLDHKQLAGRSCVVCNRSDRGLHRYGKVVNGGPVMLCDDHRDDRP